MISCSKAEVVLKQKEYRSSVAVLAARGCACSPLRVTQARVEEPVTGRDCLLYLRLGLRLGQAPHI